MAPVGLRNEAEREAIYLRMHREIVRTLTEYGKMAGAGLAPNLRRWAAVSQRRARCDAIGLLSDYVTDDRWVLGNEVSRSSACG